MIPLLETFMEQMQSNRSFSGHASLVYTPNPRGAVKVCSMFHKETESLLVFVATGCRILVLVRASELGLGRKRGIASFSRQSCGPEYNCCSSTRSNGAAGAELLKKDNQLQAVENSMRQTELKHLQASVEELQEQMSLKETEIEKTTNQLSDMQHEVESLQCLLSLMQTHRI
ncbi:hypothetical protein L7F22_039824 [Adiantum nelumboides]|nr:hypothetical protein [Adiantum nelumboides]